MSSKNKSDKQQSQGRSGADKFQGKTEFVFGRENYMLMIAGLLVIIVGFALMSGGGSSDPNVFSNEIFNTRRIVIAPIVVLLGFVVEAIAIFRTPKD